MNHHEIICHDFAAWASIDSRMGGGHYAKPAFDHVIGDPPYLPHTQDNQRAGSSGKAIDKPRPLGFSALTAAERAAWAFTIASLVRRWVIVFTDQEGWEAWKLDLIAAGLMYVRWLTWIRGDLGPMAVVGRKGAPQFTGKCPAVGDERMLLFHAPGTAMRWNGRGAHRDGTRGKRGSTNIYVHEIEGDARVHPAQKPLPLMRELVRDYTDPGDLILDPWAGAGTTVLAAKIEERSAIGIEIDAKHAARAHRRVSRIA